MKSLEGRYMREVEEIFPIDDDQRDQRYERGRAKASSLRQRLFALDK